MQQQRWSGTTAQGSGVGGQIGSPGGVDVDSDGRGGELDGQQAHELMGRPRIPSTIAELPA